MQPSIHPVKRAASPLSFASPLIRDRIGMRRIVLAWALLFALFWQSFVAQTHRHYDSARQDTAAWSLVHAESDSKQQIPADSPADCPICREIASAGPVLLSQPITIEQ